MMSRSTSVSVSGKRITVMGLGTRGGGSGVARYLVEQGAIVTVTDLRGTDDLAGQRAGLSDLPIRWVLNQHDPCDFDAGHADMVIRNPAVPQHAPMLELARRNGIPVHMEMSLFLANCLAPVVGITGTKGKTTTATICAAILREMDASTVLAGNMGVSAVGALSQILPDTPVVLEISNWQLEGTREHALSPDIAVLTNISVDHLNTYRDFAEYAAVKRSIGHFLRPDQWLVLNVDDVSARAAMDETAGLVAGFGIGVRDGIGAWVQPDRLEIITESQQISIPWPANSELHSTTQRLNAAAASFAAVLRGATVDHVIAGLEKFQGVPHRMERVETVNGILFVNDSAATAPAAAIASMQSYPGQRVHLISGGADKRLDLAELATSISTMATSVCLLPGTATELLADQIASISGAIPPIVQSMAEAVNLAFEQASAGDVVLLAPGCASFGLFVDEFDRGEQFREIVATLKQGDDADD